MMSTVLSPASMSLSVELTEMLRTVNNTANSNNNSGGIAAAAAATSGSSGSGHDNSNKHLPPPLSMNDLPEDTLIAAIALSRTVELLRFVLPPKMLDEVITEHNLHDMVLLYEQQYQGLKDGNTLPATTGVAINSLWRHVTQAGVRCTYRQCLEFDNPHYPVSTAAQRAALHALSMEDADVERDEARVVLRDAAVKVDGFPANSPRAAFDDKDTIMQCIYGDDLERVPGFVLASITAAMNNHPNVRSFIRESSRHITRSHRKLSQLIPYVAFFLVTIVAIANLDLLNMYLFQRTSWFPTTDDHWNGCENGPTDITCIMTKKNNPQDIRTTQDIDNYWRKEMILQMWPGDGLTTASAAPYFGNWLVGAMLMKVSPLGSTRAGCPTRSCRELNLSQSTDEFVVDSEFSCSAIATTDYFWAKLPLDAPIAPSEMTTTTTTTIINSTYPASSSSTTTTTTTTNISFTSDPSSSFSPTPMPPPRQARRVNRTMNSIVIIPFNTTLDEALALGSTFYAEYCEGTTSQVTMTWTMYQPSDGLLVMTTISATVPKTGSVVTRTYAKVVGLQTKNQVAVLVILQLAMFAWVVFVNVASSGATLYMRLTRRQVVVQLVLLIIIGSAYFTLARLATLDEVKQLMLQDQYVPPNVDYYVHLFQRGMDLISLWVLLFFLLSLVMFRDVIGLSVVMRLLSVAAADVLSLIVIFACITCGFICVARAMFGTTDRTFTFSTSTMVFVANFYWGRADYKTLTNNNPISGNIFFFCYVIYVVYGTLNLLVAVLTAPWREVRDAANLHLQLYEQMEEDVSNFSRSDFRWFGLRKSLMPFVAMVTESITFSKMTQTWSDYDKIVRRLYDRTATHPPFEDTANAASDLIVFMARVPSHTVTTAWDTALSRGAVRYASIPHRPSWVMLRRVLIQVSNFDLVRDAALVRALITYDEVSTPLQVVCDAQKEQLEAYLKRQADIKENASKAANATNNNNSNNAGGGDGARNNNHHYQTHGASSFRDDVEAPSPPPSFAGKKGSDEGTTPLLQTTTATTTGRKNGEDPQPDKQVATGGGGGEEREDGNSPSAAPVPFVIDDPDTYSFAENRYIVRHVRSMVAFPAVVVVVLALYLAFIVPLLLSHGQDVFLGENLLAGLRDSFWETYCYDAQCKNGFMHRKRFTDIGHLIDVSTYMGTTILPRLFTDESDVRFSVPAKFRGEAAAGKSWPVTWDRQLRRTTPVTIRQIQAKRSGECNLPPLGDARSATGANRVRAMYTTECYQSLTDFHTGSIASLRAPDSTLPPSAFEYREGCAQDRIVAGYFTLWYPCAGYTVNIYNRSQMEEVKTLGKWLSPATRLVIISASFKSAADDNLRTRIDLIIEMTKGGGAGFSWALLEPTSQHLIDFVTPALVLVYGVDVGVWLVQIVWMLVLRFRLGRPQYASHIAPKLPWVSLLVGVAQLIVEATDAIQSNKQSLHVAFLVIASTNVCLTKFVFPVVKLVTYRGARAIRTISIAVGSFGIVIPYYLATYIAFSLAGHVLFSRQIFEWSSLKISLQTAGKMFVGDMPWEACFAERPQATVLFFVAFYAIVLIILANVLLSLISGASAEAHAETATADFIMKASEVLRQTLVIDESFAVYLGWRFFLGRYAACASKDVPPSTPTTPSSPTKMPTVAAKKTIDVTRSFTTTEFGRFCRPVESFMYLFPRHQLMELAEIFELRTFPEAKFRSLAMFLVRVRAGFKERYREQFNNDEKIEFYRMMRELNEREGDEEEGDAAAGEGGAAPAPGSTALGVASLTGNNDIRNATMMMSTVTTASVSQQNSAQSTPGAVSGGLNRAESLYDIRLRETGQKPNPLPVKPDTPQNDYLDVSQCSGSFARDRHPSWSRPSDPDDDFL